MSEREFFESQIPQIAEIIVELKKMSPEEQIAWQNEWIESVSNKSEFVRKFAQKVVYIVNQYLKEGVA